MLSKSVNQNAIAQLHPILDGEIERCLIDLVAANDTKAMEKRDLEKRNAVNKRVKQGGLRYAARAPGERVKRPSTALQPDEVPELECKLMLPSPRASLKSLLTTFDPSEGGETTSSKRIKMESLFHSSNAERDSFMQMPSYVETCSNRDYEAALFYRTHLPSLLFDIPTATSMFPLLVGQRLVIASLLAPIDKKIDHCVWISRATMVRNHTIHKGADRTEFAVECSLAANQRPRFSLLDVPTGTGKTIMASVAAAVAILSERRWQGLRREFGTSLVRNAMHGGSGLSLGKTQGVELARVVVVLAPKPLLMHWRTYIEAAIASMRHTEAVEAGGAEAEATLAAVESARVWVGMRDNEDGEGHTMERAHAIGAPVVWILENGVQESWMALRQSGNAIDYAYLVWDELRAGGCSYESGVTTEENNGGRPKLREGERESHPVYNIVLQATVASMVGVGAGDVHHPIREWFGGQRLNDLSNFTNCFSGGAKLFKPAEIQMQQHSILAMCSIPKPVRRLLEISALTHMPPGLQINRLRARHKTLVAAVTSQSFWEVSLSQFLATLLRQHGVRDTNSSVEELCDLTSSTLNTPDDILRHLARLVTNLEEQKRQVELCDAASGVNRAARVHELRGVISAFTRVEARLREILAPANDEDDSLNICPITLEVIPRCNRVILGCCSAIYDKTLISTVNKRCPLCRGTIASAAIVPEDDVARDAKAALAKGRVESQKTSLKVAAESDDIDFTAFVDLISERKLDIVDALAIMMVKVLFHNASARVLLCAQLDRGGRNSFAELTAAFKRWLGEGSHEFVVLKDVEKRGANAMNDVIKSFNSGEGAAQILVVDTSSDSNSASGLDLYGTDLTILANTGSADTCRQILGRSLRMQKRPKDGSPIRDKQLVMLEMM